MGSRRAGRGPWAVGYGCVLLSFGVSAEAKGETSLQLHFISNSRRGLLYLFIAFCFFWAIRSRTSLDALCLTIANQVKEDTDLDAPEGGNEKWHERLFAWPQAHAGVFKTFFAIELPTDLLLYSFLALF